MDWKDTISHLYERYAGQGGGTAAAPADPHQDFQQVAQAAPKDVVAGGLSQAMRSDQTPPFPEIVSRLFSHSDPNQRAGLINRLMDAIGGPQTLASLPGLGGLAGMLRGGNVTAEQANQIDPNQVQQMAAHAETRNPAVVDHVSGFYAQHPQAVKALGGMALTIALQHILRRS